MKPVRIAVGYVRMSTDMQGESIAQQKVAIQKWASENGYTVVDWFEDHGKSGVSFEKRQGFMALSRAVEAGAHFRYVLVYDETRWGRSQDLDDSGYYKSRFKKLGVEVIILNSQASNLPGMAGKVVGIVEVAQAGEYSRRLSDSTKRGCNARQQAGYSSGGTAPYGYKRVAVDPVTKKYIRDLPEGVHRRKEEEIVGLDLGDPLEVATVKKIFQMKSEGLGYRAIGSRLNEQGIPCPKRGRWRSKDQKWSLGTVRSIITNPTYCGTRVYNRTPKNKLTGKPRGKMNKREEWSVTPNAHPALISKELFDLANSTNPAPFAAGGRSIAKSPYLLSGLITCSHCGFKYFGNKRTGKSVTYYQDSGYHTKGTSVCSFHAIPAAALEHFVLDAIRESLDGSHVAELFQGMVDSFLQHRESGASDERQRLEEELRDTKAAMARLLDALQLGQVKPETLIPRIQELEAKGTKLQTELDKLQLADIGPEAVQTSINRATAFLTDFNRRIEEADAATKKAILRDVVAGITVDREKDVVYCDILMVPKSANPALFKFFQSGVNQSRMCPEQDLNLHDLAATSS